MVDFLICHVALSEENSPCFFFVFLVASGIRWTISACNAHLLACESVVISFQAIRWYGWWLKSCTSWYVVYPIIYRVSAPSRVVVWDFSHHPYVPKPVGFLRSTTNLKFRFLKHHLDRNRTHGQPLGWLLVKISLSLSWLCTCFLSVYMMYDRYS